MCWKGWAKEKGSREGAVPTQWVATAPQDGSHKPGYSLPSEAVALRDMHGPDFCSPGQKQSSTRC